METCLTAARIHCASSWLPILVVLLATECSQNLNKTSSTTNNSEETSNLEKAEERRASLMQEILEEDLGDMRIRLIALEKKVDKLHPGSI